MFPLRNDPNDSCLFICSKVVACAHVMRCFIILYPPSIDIHTLLIQKCERDYSGDNK